MKCVGCAGSREDHRHLLLHNIRQRSGFQRLCTSCVLKLHPGSFCPGCLDFFEGSPPSNPIQCSKCTAAAHPACVSPEAAKSYACPSCSDPSFSFFESTRSESKQVIDLKAAKALLTAARISAVSVGRAATWARSEADKKVREAAFARKRAREALERVALVASRAKEKGKEANEGVVAAAKKKLKGNSGIAAAAAIVKQKRIQSHKFGGLSPATSDKADKREKEKWGGFQATAVLVQRPPKKAFAAVENKDKSKTGSPSSVLGRNPLQNHAVDEEKEKTGVFSGSSDVAEQKQPQSSTCLPEEDKGETGKQKGFADSDSGPRDLPPPNHGEQNASVSMVNPGVVFYGLA